MFFKRAFLVPFVVVLIIFPGMIKTETLVVGASTSGLAMAACLQRDNHEYLVIEKSAQCAVPWRRHYDRLHLHTNKRISSLPFKKFDKAVPVYPSRQQVVDYLENYQETFKICPVFNTEAKSVSRENNCWITVTNKDTFKSRFLVMATGPFGKPKPIEFKGMETFCGNIIHSCNYKTGKNFTGLKVLVVGFGNSACEIAMDLYEQGAFPCMSVRSPVNVVPRDIFGIPILEISLLMSKLPARFADKINAPFIHLSVGDIKKLGLRKPQYGPFEEIEKYGKTPVLDIGTIAHIRKGHINICDDIHYINGNTVHFINGTQENFDAMVAATGYYSDCSEIINIDKSRFEDLKLSVDKQKYFGKDDLYFCGFWIGPTGQIREISLDAQKIAKNISLKRIQTKLKEPF